MEWTASDNSELSVTRSMQTTIEDHKLGMF